MSLADSPSRPPGPAVVRQESDCEDELERNLVRSVLERGFTVLSEPAQADSPAYSYTVGLNHRFGHPELVVLGLSRERAEALLLVAAKAVKAGARLEVDSTNEELLQDYPCRIGPVDRAQHRAYLGYARWFYRGDSFTALQVVWPDRKGRFPDNQEFASSLREQQPLLS